MKEVNKTIEDFQQIISLQDEVIRILEERVELFKKEITIHESIAKTLYDNQDKYPKWLWNAIYFLAGIGFWQTLLWLL